MTQEEFEKYLASKMRTCILCNASHIVSVSHDRGLFCPSCKTPRLVRESDRVRTYVGKAERRNLPATLTVLEWLHILNYFGWKCAYCKKGKFDVLEHVVSMANGGGTTALFSRVRFQRLSLPSHAYEVHCL